MMQKSLWSEQDCRRMGKQFQACLCFAGMTNAEVLHQVEHGYRMASPQNCPPALYDIMLECWHKVRAHLNSDNVRFKWGGQMLSEINFFWISWLTQNMIRVWYSLHCRMRWNGQPLRLCSGSSRISSQCLTQSIRMPQHTELQLIRIKDQGSGSRVWLRVYWTAAVAQAITLYDF